MDNNEKDFKELFEVDEEDTAYYLRNCDKPLRCLAFAYQELYKYLEYIIERLEPDEGELLEDS